MSAIPSRARLEEAPRRDDGSLFSRPAATYFACVVVAALATAVPLLTRLQLGTRGWPAFVALAGGAALAQLFPIQTPRNQSYHVTGIFLVPAALLLPPELVALVALVQHLPWWLKNRQPWPIPIFNICNYTITLLAAWASAGAIRHHGLAFESGNVRLALAGLTACAVLVGVNHALLAPMMKLARGHSLRETDLFSFQSLSAELVVAALGVGVAAFWTVNPWLIAFALAPLVLIHRSLSVPQLQAEARVDPKTGLFNARHFAAAFGEELGRSARFERPMALIMADLDLLRDINNNYGHLAGDAVLRGIAEVFRAQLRHYDVPARFGGEEFSILLPETAPEQAFEIAERIRKAVADRWIDVETSSEPIRATVSVGVACYPGDGLDANELIHQADLAVYRAKLQGRNRVLGASSEPLLVPDERTARLAVIPELEESVPLSTRGPEPAPEPDRRHPRPHAVRGPRFFSFSIRLGSLVAGVSAAGIGAGILGLVFGHSHDFLGLIAVVVLVGGGQALKLEVDEGSISVGAVGALAGAAIFGPRAALALALASAAVGWSARRQALHEVLFNIGALSLASFAAVGVFAVGAGSGLGQVVTAVAGIGAGAAYFAVNVGLISLATALSGHERWWSVFRERFAWLLPHYLVYGFVGAVIDIAYSAAHFYALAVFAVPLLLMRKTQEAYLAHTQKSALKLREAAETIHTQNVSLEKANRLLKERSTAAMESLSATVDARDSYTAGHSRRVQQLALAVGRELGLSQPELDLLGHAALFHDIGKLAIPDAILLKPASLTGEEWALMQRHADEGARIIDRLGFLNDAVPAIRHHHERFDGSGYPDRLAGEEIPLGARIIHVADALDSMLTTRIYRAARPASMALEELRRGSGVQFCLRCVSALERILPVGELDTESWQGAPLLAAS